MLLMHVRDRRLHQPCPGLPVNIYMLRTDLIRSVACLDEDAAAAGCLRFTTAACDGVPLPLTTETSQRSNLPIALMKRPSASSQCWSRTREAIGCYFKVYNE